MGNNINHKVGIKLLSDVQLENVLPTYENLLAKIEVCRKAASNEADELRRHYQYNFMYDNVFSILGQRGTGKTSVAFTLQRKIQDKYSIKHGDVVLPIIIPEIIPENCTVLGWLLAIVGEEIEKLEEDILDYQNSLGRRRNEYSWESKEFNKSSLLEQLDKMNQLIHAGNYNPQNEKSYYRAVENSVIQAGDYYKFAKEIANLWDAWVKRIQEFERLKERKEVCPLIYFIFDDVDLAPEKIDEILSVIMKYLSHPNIIVLTTADERLFLDVIEKRLDKNIGRLPSEWRNYLNDNRNERFFWRPEYDVKNKDKDKDELTYLTAREYLGKIMPASSRYYLRTFNSAKQKQTFCVEDYIDLGEAVKKQIQTLIDGIAKEEEQPNNFMIREGEIISFYLKFMGNTSRQIGNVYIAIKELVEVLLAIAKRNTKRKDSIVTVYNSVFSFLRIALNSNHALSCKISNIDSFVNSIFLFNYNQWRLYINYSYLNEFLESELKEKDKRIRIVVGLELFSLLAFVENILLIMEKLLPNGITDRKKVHEVWFLSEFLQKEINSIRYILRDNMPSDEFLAHYTNFLERLESIVEDELVDKKFNLEFFYGFKEYLFSAKVNNSHIIEANKKDYVWFGDLIGRLFLVYGNVYLINRHDLNNCRVSWNNPYPVMYQLVIEKENIENLNGIFSKIKLHMEWEDDYDSTSPRSKNRYENVFSISPVHIKNSEFSYLCNTIKSRIPEKLVIQETGLQNREEKPARYVGLSSILKLYMDVVKKEKQKLSYNRFNEYIKEVLQAMGDNFLERSESVLRAINLYTAKLEHMEGIFRKKAIINSPYRIEIEIETLIEEYSIFEIELDEILNGLREYPYAEDTNQIIVEVDLYEKLLFVLEDINKWIERYSYKDKRNDEEQVYEIKKILNSLDLAVDVNDTSMFKSAVQVGDWVAFHNMLQEIYIYILIHERYQRGNSYSSKELEKVNMGDISKNTYYFDFFKTACGILEKKPPQNASREYKATKAVIEKAYLRERQNYVKTLIAGEK